MHFVFQKDNRPTTLSTLASFISFKHTHHLQFIKIRSHAASQPVPVSDGADE